MASRAPIPAASSQGRATSCTACRQVKLRCDARETFPAPCSRCVVKKSACRMDSNFRRTPVRRRLEEVTKELSKYQELLGHDHVASNSSISGGQILATAVSVPASSSYSDGPSSAPQTVGASGMSVVSEASSSTLAMNVLMSGVCFSPDPEQLSIHCVERFVLGDTYLDRQAAFELFQDFQSHLYSYFPVLDTSQTRDEMHEKCPLLFWTIIIITSKYSTTRTSLYAALTPAYENLLAASIVKVTRSVSQLHAVLMIIMWPLPYPGPTHDPSWGYCGLVMNAALQMGMHRPGFHREYGFPDLTQEQVQLRTVTWMMAFQTSVGLSSFLGLPPFIDATPHMDDILGNPSGLPKVIVAQTDIQLHVARFTRALDSSMDGAAKVMYINMFERDLDRLRTTFESTWTGNVEFNLIGAKLYLYSHIFVARKRSQSDRDSRRSNGARSLLLDPGSSKIIYSGLSSAVSYIHSFSELSRVAMSTPASISESPGAFLPHGSNAQMYYPHHYWRTMALAAFYLLKFLALAPDVPVAEQELARNHLTMAHSNLMMYASSVEHTATAKTFELLLRTAGMPAEGKVNTRLGASIIYDGLLTFSQLQKARSAGKLDMDRMVGPEPPSQSAETSATTTGLDLSAAASTPGGYDAAFDNAAFSIAEFLNTDWDLPWYTNFFDFGGGGEGGIGMGHR
ncbi:hypothetical protein B0H63DRAFT_463977 [Podospora didyma]|uniref:Zn(2)-C6 fungal-type domain-containing protein n=1 Tax=Podospora didyma TaxID=330526 RepID=A0AAE0NXK3_9PEZI|nr:hypothetical protein B0H63DRAFT_463977 [Podospora didyma]